MLLAGVVWSGSSICYQWIFFHLEESPGDREVTGGGGRDSPSPSSAELLGTPSPGSGRGQPMLPAPLSPFRAHLGTGICAPCAPCAPRMLWPPCPAPAPADWDSQCWELLSGCCWGLPSLLSPLWALPSLLSRAGAPLSPGATCSAWPRVTVPRSCSWSCHPQALGSPVTGAEVASLGHVLGDPFDFGAGNLRGLCVFCPG